MSDTMSASEMMKAGYLQEVNRQFFHPLGLAMWVNPVTNEMGVFDYREDPEGVRYEGEAKKNLPGKAAVVEAEMKVRYEPRRLRLGYWIQPLGDSE